MSSNVTQALFYSASQFHIDLNGQRIALLRVQYDPQLEQWIDGVSSCFIYHHDKSKYDVYAAANSMAAYDLVHDADDKLTLFDVVFLSIPKQKLQAQYLLALAVQSAVQGSKIIVAGGNKEGGAQIGAMCKALSLSYELDSKYKCRIAVITKNDALDSALLSQWLEQGQVQSVQMAGCTYQTVAGIFGWNKIDRGSALLTQNIPDNLQGMGADLGCGYGYLSCDVLKKMDQTGSLLCVDHDCRAIEACRLNTQDFGKHCEYMWHDLSASLPSSYNDQYDWVVMNPPFHIDKRTDTDLGLSFITRAYEILKKGGTLYMVANIQLPYEKYLQERFSGVKSLINQDGFKVISASK